jgi:hypothetical protein
MQQRVFRCARKRQLIHNFLLLLQVLLALPSCPGHVSASLCRQRTLLIELQVQMKLEQWLCSFRMELPDVQALFAVIADDLHRNEVKAANLAGSPIQA